MVDRERELERRGEAGNGEGGCGEGRGLAAAVGPETAAAAPSVAASQVFGLSRVKKSKFFTSCES